MPLAYHIAYYVAQELVYRGWLPPSAQLQTPDEVSYQHMRATTGVQPKASKLPPLLSEFREIVSLSIPVDVPVPIQPGEKLQSPWYGIPALSCLLKRPPLRLSGGHKEMVRCPEGIPSKKLFFGIYRSCDEFIAAAAVAGHPVGSSARLPPALAEAVEVVKNTTVSALAKQRHTTLAHWLGRAKALAPDEARFHESLHPDLKGILAPKRLLLWKEMLEYYRYPDLAVVDEVVEGVRLGGAAAHVPFFEPSFKPASMTLEELASNAIPSRTALLATVRSSGDPDMDSEIYDKTLAELDCGWLDGPYEVSELPDDAVVNRRFGIKQQSGEKVKIRLIDDFSASGVNSTVQVESSNKLHTLDVVAALCLELLKAQPNDRWVGKTVDLSAAYRQLGVSPQSRSLSFIAVFDPSIGGPKILSMKALPFGASKSVYSFLRVAHSLWWLGSVALKLTWSNFFDDFVTLARSDEAEVVSLTVSQFFRLLGWEVSTGEKDLPFSPTFKALGVEIDCSDWPSGVVRFGNTEKRVQELVLALSEVIESKQLSLHGAQVLRGRMQFAKAQMWGRSAKLCLAAVTSHAYGSTVPQVSDKTIRALEIFRDCLSSARPREISASWDRPVFVFTDASFCPEDKSWPCGLGGVLVDHDGTQLSAMSYGLNLDELGVLGYLPKSTIIFEAELLALTVCLVLWKKFLRHRPCVAYIDNNSTRDVAISGAARTSPGAQLVAKLLANEDACGAVMWFARVPSASNIADAPSRQSSEGISAKLVSKDLVRIVVSKCLACVS
eukprot:s405_g11.t1